MAKKAAKPAATKKPAAKAKAETPKKPGMLSKIAKALTGSAKAPAKKAPVAAKPAPKAATKPAAAAAKPAAAKASPKATAAPAKAAAPASKATLKMVEPEVEDSAAALPEEEASAAPVKEAKAAKPPKAPKVPKVKKVRVSKSKSDRTATPEEDQNRWIELHEKNKAEKPQVYDMKSTFEAGRPLQHKILGWGWILGNENDRLEVLFKDGRRMLISNYNPNR